MSSSLPSFRGTIAAPLTDLATELPGLLAELGVDRLSLNGKALPPRQTNLPQLLLDAQPGVTLTTPDATITLTDTGLTYSTNNPTLAKALASLHR